MVLSAGLSVFAWVLVPFFLFPLVAGFLSFHIFSGSFKSPKLATGVFFLFSRRWCYGSSMRFLSCPQPIPSFLSMLPAYQSSHYHTWLHVQGVSHGTGLALGYWGCPQAWGDSWVWYPRGSWVDFPTTTVSRNLVPFLPLSQSPPPPSHGVSDSALWVLLERNGFLQPWPAQLGLPGTHSLLSFSPEGEDATTIWIKLCAVFLGRSGWESLFYNHLHYDKVIYINGFPGGTSHKEPSCQCRRYNRHGSNPWDRKISWRRVWQPTPGFLPRESHGQMSLAGYSPCGPTGSWMKWLSVNAYRHIYIYIYLLLLFNHSVVSNSLRPMDCSMSGFPVLHHLLELAQTHVHWVGDAIQPSHPLLPLSPPASYLSQHQLVGSSHQVAKVLELQLQHQSFQWIFRIDFLLNWLVWSPCSPRDSQESSSTPQFKSINSLVLILVYGPTLTSIHEYIYTHIYIFCSNVLLESPSQVVEPLQICLRIVYLLSQHSSDMYVCVCIYIYIFFFFFFLIAARGVRADFLASLIPQPIPRSVCLLLGARVGRIPLRSWGSWR